MDLHNTLIHGLNTAEPASILIRSTVGPFFVFSGFHKLFNPTRRASLAETFKADGCYSPPLMWVIPLGELFGGLGVTLGAATLVAAAGLIALCLGACVLDGRKRVAAYQPLDLADRVDDYLYLPEVLYVVMLLALIAVGPGSFSLDAAVAHLI
jgi:uncharacterized membrane protein YphA (DoxX/SURF4 family)